jgi:hypothetical protein
MGSLCASRPASWLPCCALLAGCYATHSRGDVAAVSAPPSTIPRAPDGGRAVDNADACRIGTLVSKVTMTTTPGNLLIIFDQSGSMNDAWMGTTKLAAAREALVQAITPLQNQLEVGAIFLPDPAVLCDDTQPAVQPIDGLGNIPFRSGSQFIQAFQAHWDMFGSTLAPGTPLNEAFDRADVALQAALTSTTLVGKFAVLVFTDGRPNCPLFALVADGGTGDGAPLPEVTGIPTKPEAEHAADWFAQGVPTYMIGLPGAMDGVELLNDVALRGSGGALKTYISPSDPQALATKLDELVQRQVSTALSSCSIDLVPAALEPETLQLVVEAIAMKGLLQEVPHDLGGAGGWTIASDGSSVELSGELCDRAKRGDFSQLAFWHGCNTLPRLASTTPAR